MRKILKPHGPPQSPQPAGELINFLNGHPIRTRSVLKAVFFGCLFLTILVSHALAQQVRLTASSNQIFAGLPFTLTVEASGFLESPEPTISELHISGAELSFLGVSPSVSSFLSIINGRRTERKEVRFLYSYRVTVMKAGTYQVPSLSVTQGKVSRSTSSAQFEAREIPTTGDMLIELELPDRSIWVGETVPIRIRWYLRRDVSEQTFVVPLFNMEEHFEVRALSSPGKKKALTFSAGSKKLDLPYESTKEKKNGKTYTLFLFQALITPSRPGTIELPPARVVAQLQVGSQRNVFGLLVGEKRLFQAVDQSRTLTVRPLPEAHRPESFSGAIGTGFEYTVKADRTVVRVGDPIELEAMIKGRGSLEGISMPPLSAASLSTDLFSFPDELPAGKIQEDGSKVFKVSLRVKSNKVHEIPPLPFSYFNPQGGKYVTVRSLPIALSVKGSALVDADAVIAARSANKEENSVREQSPPATQGDDRSGISLMGADLSLSEPSETFKKVADIRERLPLILALYLFPAIVLGWRVWYLKTGEGRRMRSEVQHVVKACVREIDSAAKEVAGEGGARVANALKVLRMALHVPSTESNDLIHVCESLAFDPSVKEKPLPDDVIDSARHLAEKWGENRRRDGERRGIPAASILVLPLSLFLLASSASAEVNQDQPLPAARQKYESALLIRDRDRRVASFTEAQSLYGEFVRSYTNRPALLVDWGNAALGARDLGTAVLAYRRALVLDPGDSRARRNLSWIRSRMPSWLPIPEREGAVDSLLFWHQRIARQDRLTLGAVCFALLVFFLAPWGKRLRGLRRLAVFAAVFWIGLTASLLIDENPNRAAVVVRDGSTIRSADSIGATPAFPRPVPAGTELTIVEIRDAWYRIELANGNRGWIKKSEVERVMRRG